MKFLCTKVKDVWLSSQKNCEKVHKSGLKIINPFIGIELDSTKPTEEEFKKVEIAINELFGENKKAFPVRLIEL